MKVFVSWSGETSRLVAASLREWLQLILQKTEPWMSEKDVGAGMRWDAEIEGELAAAKFGNSCITSANLAEPWLLFEAGAIATTVKEVSRLCPYLINLEPSDLQYPLARYQGVTATKEGTLKLVRDINSTLKVVRPGEELEDNVIEQLFGALWPKLEDKISKALETRVERKPKRARDLPQETLEAVRDLARGLDALQESVVALRGEVHSLNPAFPFPGLITGVPSGNLLSALTTPWLQPVIGEGAGAVSAPVLFPVSSIGPELRKKLKEGSICGICGSEDVKLENRGDVSPTKTTTHYDRVCQACSKTLKQFHRKKLGEDQREYVCLVKCPYHQKNIAGGG